MSSDSIGAFSFLFALMMVCLIQFSLSILKLKALFIYLIYFETNKSMQQVPSNCIRTEFSFSFCFDNSMFIAVSFKTFGAESIAYLLSLF